MEEPPDNSSAKTIVCSYCGGRTAAYLLAPRTDERICFTCYLKAKRAGTEKQVEAPGSREDQGLVLKALRRHAAGLSPTSLAHRTGLELGCVVRVLSELVGEGKAERQGVLCRHVPAERESAAGKRTPKRHYSLKGGTLCPPTDR